MRVSFSIATVCMLAATMHAQLAATQWGAASSAAVPVEMRTSFGGRLAHGTERLGVPDGSASTNWDTTTVADGWRTLASDTSAVDVAVLNSASVSVEGGRLQSNATWTSSSVHLLRHKVVIPTNMTLTVNAGTVVKFTENAGIVVEDGGTLKVLDNATNNVWLAMAEDDGVGGDTDMRSASAVSGVSVYKFPSGKITENGYVALRDVSMSGYGSVSLNNAQAAEASGVAYVAVTVSGTRNAPFSVDWVAEDGTAKFGADYTLASGMLSWTGTSEGTKYIAIPLVKDAVTEDFETFKVRITTMRGMNAAVDVATVTVSDSELFVQNSNFSSAIPQTSNWIRVEARTNFAGQIVKDQESLMYACSWTSPAAANVRLTAQRRNEAAPITLFTSAASDEGAYAWDTSALTEGCYTLTHQFLDAAGTQTGALTAQLYVVRSAFLHGGTLSTNETWSADVVHLVTETVIVPSGMTLTIESGTIVKFCSGTGIQVLAGGTLVANGVRFTHFADDTLGGDTNMDGSESKPSPNVYSIGGAGTLTMDSSTELHYTTQQTSGTISGTTTWLPGRTYCITGDITVASGGALTIPAGTILKFSAGKSLIVNSGGTLTAIGTRVQPIIFTSYRDDANGGDTNGDGKNTVPQPGDWTKLGVAGGTANMSYVSILYSSKNETTGAINMNGGVVTFVNGIIAHGMNDAVGVESGSFFMTNSIVQDCLVAFRHWPRDPIVNCVVYDCGRITQGGGQTFVNCTFSKIAEVWEAFGFPRSTYKNCNFYNDGGTVLQGQDALSVAGSGGNIWGDPLFNDADTGDFTVHPRSPLIDAGDGATAPATDYYGQPRMNAYTSGWKGVPDSSGHYPDMGVFEYGGGSSVSEVDLAALRVTAPANMEAGQAATVQWVVQNVGTKGVDCLWRDAVSLVSESGRVVNVGSVYSKNIGIFAPWDQTVNSLTFTVPPVEEGKWRVRVDMNVGQDVFEGSLTTNNVGYSEATSVTLPGASVLENPVQLAVEGTGTRVLRLDGLPQLGGLLYFQAGSLKGVELYLGNGVVPSAAEYTWRPTRMSDGTYVIALPAGMAPGPLYVVAKNNGAESVSVTISAVAGELKIAGVSRTELPLTNRVSLSVYGAGLTNSAVSFCLKGTGGTIPSTGQTVLSPTEVSVLFDVSAALAGNYSLEVHSGDASDVWQEITLSGAKKGPALSVAFDGPEVVRQGRWYTEIIRVTNTGDADAEACVFVLSSNSMVFRDPDNGATERDGDIHLLVMPAEGDPRVIRPGATVSLYVEYQWKTGTTISTFHYRMYSPSGKFSWETVYGHNGISDADWSAFIQPLQTTYGSFGGFFGAMLDEGATARTDSFIPRSAAALYEVEKLRAKGVKLGTVSGVLLDAATQQPKSEYLFAVTSTNSPYASYARTDANGRFVAYGVPYGELVFLSNDSNNVYAAEMVTLAESRKDGIRLFWSVPYDIKEDDAPTETNVTVNVLSGLKTIKLGGQPVVFWHSNGDLYVAKLADSTNTAVKLDAGVPVSAFAVTPVSDDTGLLVFAPIANQTDSLRWFMVNSGENGALTITGGVHEITGTTNASSLGVSYGAGDAFTVAYSQYDGTVGGKSVYTKTVRQDQSKAGVMPISNNSLRYLSAIAPDSFHFPIRGIGELSISGNLYDSGVQNSAACCLWVHDGKLSGGNAEIILSSSIGKAVPINTLGGNGQYDISETFYCKHYFNPEQDCERDTQAADYCLHAKGDVYFGYTADVSAADYLGSHANAVPVNITGALALTVHLSGDWSEKTTRRRDYSYSDKSLTTGVYIKGKGSATLSFGFPGTTKYGESKPGCDWNGEMVVTAGISNSSEDGFAIPGSISVKIGSLSGSGDIRILPSEGWRIAFGNIKWSSESQSSWSSQCLQSTGVIGSTALAFATDENLVASATRTFADRVLNVFAPLVVTEKNGNCYLWIQEKVDQSGHIYTALLFRERINDEWLDPVESCTPGKMAYKPQAVVLANGDLVVVFAAADPYFGGTPEDLLASYMDTRLYYTVRSGGVWSQPQRISDLDSVEAQYSLAADATGTGAYLIWNARRRLSDTTDEVSIRYAQFEGGTWSTNDTVARVANDDLNSLTVYDQSGAPAVLWSLYGDDDTNDVLMAASKNGGTWTCSPQVIAMPASGTATQTVQMASTIKAKTASENFSLMQMSSGHACTRGCYCGCMSDPPPGCGCATNCMCNGKCGKGCKCGDDGHRPRPGRPIDPNEIVGPDGLGDSRLVVPGAWMNYIVYFENKSTADVPAQEIVVDMNLSPWLDWSSFEVGEVVFNNQTETGLRGKRNGELTVPQRGSPLSVRIESSLNAQNGAVRWHLRSYDSSRQAYDYWPEAVDAGFLPPNDDTHKGEGYISCRVKVRADAPLNSRIDASAKIIFDYNDPISTDPAWWNTVAATPMVSFCGADGVTNVTLVAGMPYGDLPEPAARAGYAFGGWWTGPGGTGARITVDAIVPEGGATLYAQWIAFTYTLFYTAATNGTVQGVLVQRVDYGTSGAAVEAVADPGYHFIAWSDGRTDNPRVDTNVTSDVTVEALFNGVAFESDEMSVREGTGSIALLVQGGLTSLVSSVAYWVLPGTATAGTDYTPPAKQPQRIAWTNEFGEKTITIPIKTDTAVEDAETFYVLLGSPTNCAIGEPKVCKVTITDANSGLTLAEALDNALLKWTTGGTAAWLPQTNVTYDGVDAAASGAVASNKLSYVKTSVTGTGTLSYAWSVAGRGVLRLSDGTRTVAAVTNTTAWATRSIILTQNAAHTLKWEFTNLGGTNSFAYLDQVVWLPGGKTGVAVTATAVPSEGGAASGTGDYYSGAKVPLAVAARPGWLFTGWTPTNLFAKPTLAAQTLAVGGAPVSVTAHFIKVPVVIGLPNPPEGGTVSGSGLCLPGKSVTLKATPTTGWSLTSWSDGSQAATRAVAATTDMTFYASFKPISAITAPTVADPGAQSAMVGVLFNLALNVESECLPTVKVSGLPKGLAFNASNLTISGVPSAVPVGGLSTATVSASNPGGNGATVAFAITVSPLDSRAQGTFTGVASDDDAGDNAVRGLLNATVTPQGAFSAKSVMQSGAVRFTSKSWDSASNGVFRATLKTTKGETLSLAQDTASAWNMVGLTGALTGGAFSNSVLSVSGQRGPMSAKTAADYAAGTNVLTRYKGYYTVALPPDDVLEAPGAAGNVPLGSGYLTLTVKDGGAVALVGKLADGTALSGASALIAVADSKAGEAAYVPFLFPLYGAKGVFSGVLEILPGELVGDNVARPCDNFAQAWSYPGKAPASKPTQTEDRFMLSLGMSGGWYNSLTDLRAHYSNAVFSAASSDVTNVYVSGVYTAAVGVVDAALPEVPLAINPATGLISLSSGKAPVYNPATGAYAYAPTNPAVATFKLTKATGIFSGTFNLYYEYRDQTGALKLKTVSVAHAGVLTPVNAEPGTEPAGQGFYLVPDTWKSSDAKPVVYPIKRSYGVEILDGE